MFNLYARNSNLLIAFARFDTEDTINVIIDKLDRFSETSKTNLKKHYGPAQNAGRPTTEEIIEQLNRLT
jgi:hypothetical protein